MSIKEIINRNGFRFNKSYGQNFITDINLLLAIVNDAGICDADMVLEIGAGAGTLTACLAEKAKKVISYEIDKNLIPILKETLKEYSNIELIFKDFLQEDIEELIKKLGKCKVVANLPYYITTPVIMRLIENRLGESITVMVQQEVAERLIAAAGSKEYGAITAQINLVGEVSLLRKVSKNMFTPAPEVNSAVVRIDIKNKFSEAEVIRTKPIIKAAFCYRRKTLANNLIKELNISREKVDMIIKCAGLPADIRGEKLTARQFVELSKIINNEV